MEYSIDRDEILSEFPKYLLYYKTKDEAIAYLLRDQLRKKGVESINYTNRLLMTSYFQDMMDVVNPYIGNIYSAFDMDAVGKEITIQFYADSPEKTRADFETLQEYATYIESLDLEKKRKEITVNL